MGTGAWVAIGILLFFIGSIMALQPSAREKALGKLREDARKMGLKPRVVPCPDWLISPRGVKGKGMVPLYGLILPEAKLPLVEALVLDGVIEIVNGDHTLADMPLPLEGALGITMQASFVGLYWDEKLAELNKSTPDIRNEKLRFIKENLQMVAEKVQAKRNLTSHSS